MRSKATFTLLQAPCSMRTGSVMGEDSLLERVAAAEERQLSHNSLIATGAPGSK
jgi:hypothetical protein